MIEVHNTSIKDVKLIKPHFFEDKRGCFVKSFEKEIFQKQGIDFHCWEVMESRSEKGTLRGLHFQNKYSQAKIVRVVSGQVYDVVVDLRKESSTFGKWQGFYLDDNNKHVLYVPKGFAHGFLVLSDKAIFSYIADEKYSPQNDSGIIWNDKQLNISWPIDKVESLIISEKDLKLQTFYDFCKNEEEK